tara:strand:+ start:2358 stop:2870 length:513 start_codon:yes stop_codon:yes gene_type:complete
MNPEENIGLSEEYTKYEKELDGWHKRISDEFDKISDWKQIDEMVDKYGTYRLLFRYPEHDIMSACVGNIETMRLINRPSTYFAVSALVRNIKNLASELTFHSKNEWWGESNDMDKSIVEWSIPGVASVKGELTVVQEAAVVDDLIKNGFKVVYVVYGSEIHHRWNKYVGD